MSIRKSFSIGVVSLCVLLAALMFMSGSALAAAPEAPETVEPAAHVSNTGATFEGVVNPKASAPVSWFFQYAEGASCSAVGAGRTRVEPTEGTREVEALSVTGTAGGLEPGTEYTFCLIARGETEEETQGNEVSFTTTALPPVISEETSSNVTSTEATLGAQIDPHGSAGTFKVEYGTSGGPRISSTEATLPAADEPVGARANLSGLLPETTYEYRFVATTLSSVPGETKTFVTPAASSSALKLPDDRAYELVSPVGSLEAYVPTGPAESSVTEEDIPTERPFRSAADGNSVVYLAEPPASGEGGNGSQGPGNGNEYLAVRNTDSGWQSTDITPPNSPLGARYLGVAGDLSTGFLQAGANKANPPVPAEPSAPPNCVDLYARTTSDGNYHSLFTEAGSNCSEEPLFAGGNKGTAEVSENSRILFQTASALTPEAEDATGDGLSESAGNLYDSSAGVLHLVNVLPGGGTDPKATFGSPVHSSPENRAPGLGNVISADGSRMFWSTVTSEGNPEALYAREDDATTIQLDQAEAGVEGPSGKGLFMTASEDGSKVFFLDCSRLTASSTAVESQGCIHQTGFFGEQEVRAGNDLYEYDFSKPVGERLIDLTVDSTPSDDLGADVQGIVGASEDGSYVYFVAGGVLASNENGFHEKAASLNCNIFKAEHHEGETGEEEQQQLREEREEQEGELLAGQGCNLYLLHAGEPVRFIARLAPRDDVMLPEGGDWSDSLSDRTAESTADGRALVFESRQPLTGYENRLDLGAGKAREVEVYVYEAPAGRLSCASCDPSGAPVRPSAKGGNGTFVPISSALTFQDRWTNDAGTEVFFDSDQPLVSRDTNGRLDVYEWEREGSGSCPTGAGGCVFLVSSGTSADQSYLIDASADGSDVFFTTRDHLVPQDQDHKMYVYDARVGGGFTETSLECTGTGCQGVPPAPPGFATPASVTFAGTGNFPPLVSLKPVRPKLLTRAQKLAKALKACAKKPKRHRAACRAEAKRRYGPVRKASRSNRRDAR